MRSMLEEILANVLTFRWELRSIINREERKKGRETKIGLNRSFTNHWLMVTLNFSLDNVRNFKETTTFVKKLEKSSEYKKKEILNFVYN